MKKLFAVLALAAGIFTVGAAASAGQEKSNVCHHADDQQVFLISVADPAVDSHIAHGDAQPGDAIPPSVEYPDGAVYGPDCTPVPNPPPVDDLASACAAAGGTFSEATDPTGVVQTDCVVATGTPIPTWDDLCLTDGGVATFDPATPDAASDTYGCTVDPPEPPVTLFSLCKDVAGSFAIDNSDPTGVTDRSCTTDQSIPEWTDACVIGLDGVAYEDPIVGTPFTKYGCIVDPV